MQTHTNKKGEPKNETALEGLFPASLRAALVNADIGAREGFEGGVHDVVTDNIYPRGFAGHPSKVKGMTKCYNHVPFLLNRWKRFKLTFKPDGEATLTAWDVGGGVKGWTRFPDRDVIALEPAGTTALYSITGVRVHTRLMAIALMHMCAGSPTAIAASWETNWETKLEP